MEDTFNLTASKKQFEVIKCALDFYSRFGSGQLSIGIGDVCFENKPQFERKLPNLASDQFESDIGRIINHLFDQAPLSISSYELSESFKIAYDVMQTIRHGIAKHSRTLPSCDVSYDKPIKYSREQLPKFESHNGKEKEDQTKEG